MPVKWLIVLFFTHYLAVCHAQSDSLILRPGPSDGHDAIVWSIFPEQNFGPNEEATLTAWTYQGNFSIKRYYVQFPLGAITIGTTIDSAFLYLYNNPTAPSHDGKHSGGDNPFIIQRVPGYWNPNGITYANQPGGVTQNQVVWGPTTSTNENFKIPVGSLVNDMLAYGNHGFYLRMVTEETYRSIVCASAEHGNPQLRPMLKVYYRTCPLPRPDFTWTSNAIGNSFAFQHTGNTTGNATFLWIFDDGDSSTLENPIKTFTRPGWYNVCLKTTNDCGTATFCKSITILPTLHVGPNPTQGPIVWTSALLTATQVQIFSAAGQLMEVANLQGTQGTLELGHLTAGVYLLRFETSEGTKIFKTVLAQ